MKNKIVRSRALPYLFILFFIIALATFLLTFYLRRQGYLAPDQMPVINKRTRLLVIAPHCDDEALGSFGVIDTVIRRGGRVQVAVLTNGDASHSAVKFFQSNRLTASDYIRFGEIRRNESRKVLQAMKVTPANFFFLTYPDKGLSSLWSKNWSANHPYTNTYTGANSSPYPESYHPKTIYSGANLSRDLRKIINRFRPSIIIYPHPDERHPDHWAAYAFVKYVLEGWYNQKPRQLLYLIHYNQWPEPMGLSPGSALEPPGELTDTVWAKPTLSPDKINQKQRLINNYASQMAYLPQFMLSFARKNELFGDCKPTKLVFSQTGLVLYEPLQTLNKPVPPGRISSLNLTDTQNLLTFRLQIKDHLAPDLFYYLDLTLFQKKNPPLRALVMASHSRVRLLSWIGLGATPFSKNNGLQASLNAKMSSIVCQIKTPWSLKSILVSGYIYRGTRRIDKTAWRFITLPRPFNLWSRL